MLTRALASCYPHNCREERRHSQRLSEVLHHQNNCCLWKGQVGDPGCPFVAVTTSILSAWSRKAPCLCAIKEARFWFYAQTLDLAKFESSLALMGDHNIPQRWWHSIRMGKSICFPIPAQLLLRSSPEQMAITHLSLEWMYKSLCCMIHMKKEREQEWNGHFPLHIRLWKCRGLN